MSAVVRSDLALHRRPARDGDELFLRGWSQAIAQFSTERRRATHRQVVGAQGWNADLHDAHDVAFTRDAIRRYWPSLRVPETAASGTAAALRNSSSMKGRPCNRC
jgi:hypothetical protein